MGLGLPGRADDGAGELLPDLWHLTGLCVVPAHQLEGHGGRLLDHLLSPPVRKSRDRVTLWTHQDNHPARRLFESRGFHPTGRTGRDESGDELVHLELLLG
jgi:ribosomal protein S18 acetylase RimI-like enzyme